MSSLHDTHPDEGTIHAWLDRQLDATSTATLEAHLQRCDDCAERVAEARGLIAGTSRILASLDDERSGATPILRAAPPSAVRLVAPLASIPELGNSPVEPVEPVTPVEAGVEPESGSAVSPPTGGRVWRAFRVTPVRAAIAATLVVAIGLTLTRKRTGPDTVATSPGAERPVSASAGVENSPAQPRDHLLDSAIARNLAQVQPPRSFEASPRAAAAVSSVTVPSLAVAPESRGLDSTSATRVAIARAAVRAQRETTVGADLARVAQAPAPTASAPTDRAIVAAKVADSLVGGVAGVSSMMAGRALGVVVGLEVPQCYRVESATGTAATWGSVALPLVIALDAPATRPGARILSPEGAETDSRATFERTGDDSLLFTLRRIGYNGTLSLGAPGEVRAGVMRSSQTHSALQAMVVTSADTKPQNSATRRPKVVAPEARVAPVERQEAASLAPAVPVVARRIICPVLK